VAKEFSVHDVQTGPGAHLLHNPMGTGGGEGGPLAKWA